jgi:D-alanyl-D-alanine carboxypeptidase/D-alanyl-D-alanine-endopeptidase (penicillin-binding protein 4)
MPLTAHAHSGRDETGALQRNVQEILADPVLAQGETGVMIADVATGKTLFSQNVALRLMPASNRKIFVGAAALELLGPDCVLHTRVYATVPPDSDGTINGDLVLAGGGDALLSTDDLAQMAKLVAAKGIRQITGNVAVNDAFLSGSRWGEGWAVDTLTDSYAPEISALEVNEGCVDVSVGGGAVPGDAASVETNPPGGYVSVQNDCVTVQSGVTPNVTISRPFDKNEIDVSGTVPADYRPTSPQETLTVRDPALFAGSIFKAALVDAGISVTGKIVRSTDVVQQPAVLVDHVSLPMRSYVGKMLKPSDNLLAETLLRAIGAVKGKSPDYDGGHAVETTWLHDAMGVAPDDLSLADGSGVSRLDLVTARAEMQLLLGMARLPDFPIFYSDLSVVGVDGTASDRMIGTSAAGNAHVKTGYIRHTRALAGYVDTKSHRRLAFVMLMNGYTVPNKAISAIQDKIVELLANLK